MKFEVKDGWFSYQKEKPVLQKINLTAEKGEVISILGPNGVGKTTLLKCILGFQMWQKGNTYCDGIELSKLSKKEFWKKVSYVPQAKYQTFPFTVFETVLLGRNAYLNIFQTPGKKDEEEAMHAIEMCGIEHLKESICSQISGGELQLVLIARALATKPEVIILDEPETGLDYKNQLLVLNLIEKLSKENHLTVLFNTHYPNHAFEISDKTLLLNKDGSSIFGKTQDVLTEKNLSETFDVNIRMETIQIDGKAFHTLIPVSLRGEKYEWNSK